MDLASTSGSAMPAGCHVATMADLNGALGQWSQKLDDHKKWVETSITDFVLKIRAANERIDANDREQSTSIEALNADMKALRSSTVTTSSVRTQINAVEKVIDTAKEEQDLKNDQLKKWVDTEISNIVGGMRSKLETASATAIANNEKMRVMEDTLLPQIKADAEEQKAKRLGECQRLEVEIEKAKDALDQKIAHTAAALRFYVTASASKLREELVPLTMIKELEEDVRQRDSDMQNKMKACEDAVTVMRTENSKQKEQIEASLDKNCESINKNSKMVKILETTVPNIQSSIAGEIQAIHDTIRTESASQQTGLAEARAAAARSAVANDNAIQAVAGEINSLKQLRELIVDRLHIEKVVAIVREWQTGHVPQTMAFCKDIEDRLKRIQSQGSKDHEVLETLSKRTAAIQGHFKMFHAIASGLDESAMAAPPADPVRMPFSAADDSRLPPINSARGPKSQSPMMS